ncbi:hypothetical protein ACFLSJ_00265 [Verrucomicrobiota bacterium]
MPRNLDRRIELLVPVEDPVSRRRLIGILKTCFADTAKSRLLTRNGQYERVQPKGRAHRVRGQEVFYRQACDAAAESVQKRKRVLEPHKKAAGKKT